MTRWALLDGTTVVNVIDWDGDLATYDPSPLIAVPYNAAVHALAVSVESVNETVLRAEAEVAITQLRQITSISGNFSTAQTSNAARTIARALIVLLRLYLRRLDATD